jgi:hypothetical protein
MEMNKKLKETLLNIAYFLLGLIGGLTLAAILEWRFRKQMEKRGYRLECCWSKIDVDRR